MNLAGIGEFILGSTFQMTVFVVYACHEVNLAYTNHPSHALVSAFGPGGDISKEWNSAQGHYALCISIVSFMFLLGSLQTNGPFVIIFFMLALLFGFVAAANYQVGYDQTAEGFAYAARFSKIGGGFGFVGVLLDW